MLKKSPYLKFLILSIAYLLVSLFLVALIHYPNLADERAGVIQLTNFDGYKPFQYRMLMPLFLRGIEFLTPEVIENKIAGFLRPNILERMGRHDVADYKVELVKDYTFRVVLYVGLNTLMLLSFMFAIRKLAGLFDYFPDTFNDLLPLGLVVIIPIFYNFPNYSHDFSHLLLFTLGLYYMYQQNWLPYIIIFALAIINKETAVMLAVVYFYFFKGLMPQKPFYKILTVQLALFAVIKSILSFTLPNNPGVFLESHLKGNLQHLADISNYFRFEPLEKGTLLPSAVNIPLPANLNLPMLAIIVFLIAYAWSAKPLFLRKSMIYFPLLVIIGMFFGNIFELRSFYDFLPIVYLLSLMGIYRIYQNMTVGSMKIQTEKPG